MHKQKLAQNSDKPENSFFPQNYNTEGRKQQHELNHDESIKTWVLEQRIKQLEYKIIKQDNQWTNLND